MPMGSRTQRPMGKLGMQSMSQQPAGGMTPGGAGMMDMDDTMMGGMSGGSGGSGAGAMGGKSGMSTMDQMMSMGMSRMGGGSMASALPGFPGASHIYHIGATGFFVDHGSHITLTTEQETRLNGIKEAALLEQATMERRIEQAEQDLWDLTGSDSPDATKIEAKAREIEKLRADQRIAFTRAVGNAATVLTAEQRKQLTGMLPPNPTPPTQPMQPQAMTDM